MKYHNLVIDGNNTFWRSAVICLKAMIEQEGEELSQMALDLVGKLGSIICGEADAVGYLYRKDKETHISFEGGGNSIKEARAPHLRGKNIIIATGNDDGSITTYWDRIYKD